MKSPQPVEIVWFKRDLRVIDHQPLFEAARRGPVLPLLVIERAWWGQPDMSGRQYQFFFECVQELSNDLGALGQPLIIRVGDVVNVLNDLRRVFVINGLWSHQETGGDWTYRRDQRVKSWCRSHSVPWTEFHQDGVTRQLKSRDGWAQNWDLRMAQPVCKPPKTLAPVHGATDPGYLPCADKMGLLQDDPALRQKGGRRLANETLESFLNKRGEAYRSAMSSPISGEQSCSRLSPYIAWGALSLREVAHATWSKQRALKRSVSHSNAGWRASLKSFNGRLHWHCHFMQKLEDETRLEFENLHPAYNEVGRSHDSEASRLKAWCRGETGLPFVDACMRYLSATGWLNFRMRAMLISTASYHLWLHWRLPGLHLAQQFTDYEPGIHWPQVQMQSGTTGINTARIYNPIKQGHEQDPSGDFVRRWVPELADFEGSSVHEPWKSTHAARVLDKSYPMPVVDHIAAAREARQKIYAVRKSTAFRGVANKIRDKHASRKSNKRRQLTKRQRSSTSSAKHADVRQQAFDFTSS